MKFVAPVAVLAMVAVAIAAWLRGVDEALLRYQLVHGQFWVLEAQAVLLAVLTAHELPRLLRALAPSRRERAAVVGAVLLLLFLGGVVAPRTNRIYYDEHIYQGIGQSLADSRLAQMCNDGTVEAGVLDCLGGEYNKEPPGWSYLLSVGYRLFGTRPGLAHGLNLLCSAALVLVVALLAAALFGDRRAGVYAAFALALVPQQILWAPTAAVEPSAALFCALAVLAAVHHTRERRDGSLLWVVAACAFAVQFRPEALLVLPVVLLAGALLAPGELARPRLWWGLALGLVLVALHVGHFAAVRHESWGAAADPMSLVHFWPNLAVNGRYYLDPARFPLLFTVLAFFGATARPLRPGLVPLAAFAAFWGVFLFFYAGSYDFGADVRYSLMSNAWLCVLAGRGATWLDARAATAGVAVRTRLGAAAIAVLVPFSWFLPQIRAHGEESWAARADIAFAEEVIPQLPPNSTVLTHNPSIFLLYGQSAAQMSIVISDPAHVVGITAPRYAGGVFLHWNAWCGFPDPVQQEFCAAAMRIFSSDVFRERRVRDFRFAFYRLKIEGTVPKRAP